MFVFIFVICSVIVDVMDLVECLFVRWLDSDVCYMICKFLYDKGDFDMIRIIFNLWIVKINILSKFYIFGRYSIYLFNGFWWDSLFIKFEIGMIFWGFVWEEYI